VLFAWVFDRMVFDRVGLRPSVVKTKVLIDLFQKVAGQGQRPWRAPQSAKRFYGVSFFAPTARATAAGEEA
jgi:hypothetical protein